MKFELGQIVVTPKAREVLRQSGRRPEDLLSRHQQGDWGDVSAAAEDLNRQGLEQQFSLVSCYAMPSGKIVTVFTKADRSCTLVHLAPAGIPKPVAARTRPRGKSA